MKTFKGVLLAVFLIVGFGSAAESQVCMPGSVGCPAGGGSSTLTAGTTATSGCTNGGFLYSFSSLIQCGANAVNSGSTVTIGGGITGTSDALIVNNNTSTGAIFIAQDNGSAKFSILDGGNVTAVSGANAQWTLTYTYGLRLAGATNSSVFENNYGSGDTVWTGTAARNTMGSTYSKGASGTTLNTGWYMGNGITATSDGYGNGLRLTGFSSTTGGQDLALFGGVWSDYVHATRTSYAVTQAVQVAGSLSTVAMDGVYFALADNVATTFAVQTLGDDTGGGGTIHYCVYAKDATTAGVECGSADYAGVDVTSGAGGEVCSTPGKIGTPLQALSGSTLTVTFSASTGTDLCNLIVTANTDIATPTALYIKWSAHNSGQTLTPQ